MPADPNSNILTSPCQPRPIDPLPLVIPGGGISLLAGAPSIGKTALLATYLRDLYAGVPINGHQPNPVAAIGFINADRGWDTGAGEWFKRAGFTDLRFYSMADDRGFSPRRLRKRHERTLILAEFIDKLSLPPSSLLCVDPIALFLGGNLLDYDACAVACHEIRQVLRDRFLTMWSTAHSSKLKADKKERYVRMQDQILGSTAIFGFTDTQMYLASPAETGKPYYTFLWQSHLAPAETFYLERDEQGLFLPYGGPLVDQIITTPMILELFPDTTTQFTGTALKQRAADFAIPKATLYRFLKELIDSGHVEKVAHNCYRRRPVS